MHAFSGSSSYPAAVVEKSPTIIGSKVAQRLLLEAYRFQAMTSTDALDVDEHFPGNHRVKVSCSAAALSDQDRPTCLGSFTYLIPLFFHELLFLPTSSFIHDLLRSSFITAAAG